MNYKILIFYTISLFSVHLIYADKFFTILDRTTQAIPVFTIGSIARWTWKSQQKSEKENSDHVEFKNPLNPPLAITATGLSCAAFISNPYRKLTRGGGINPGAILEGLFRLGISTSASFLAYSIIAYGYHNEWKNRTKN